MWLFLVLGVIFALAIMLCCLCFPTPIMDVIIVFSLLFIGIICKDIKELELNVSS